MSNFTRVELPLSQADNNLFYATFYHADLNNTHYKGTIIYFHGGGLIFGQRDDLPAPYIDLMTEAGYGILTVDYLLAPESSLDQIMASTTQAVAWFIESAQAELSLAYLDYYLMGRSAGAYIAI